METMTEREPLVTLTEGALNKVKKLLAEQDNPDLFLRIGVKGGGCSGLSYVLSLDQNRTPYDQEFAKEGVRIVVDGKSLLYLAGVKLDYTYDLLSGGFKFDNPNAKKNCGCGSSFAAQT